MPSFLAPEELEHRPQSVGKSMPNQEVWIVDDEGCRVGQDTVGELVVRGSNVMRGYWGLPEETDRVLRFVPPLGEKFLCTGDLFKMDEEGYLYFIGRKDDTFKCRGERISPREIEDVISLIKEVETVAVMATPDRILGNAISVYIVCKKGSMLREGDIIKYCKMNLEDFMVPKYFNFVEYIPMTPNGKIDKLALKEINKKCVNS